MKKYKGLLVPELRKRDGQMNRSIQDLHCRHKSDCTCDCDKCMYDFSNLKQFTEWYNKKK